MRGLEGKRIAFYGRYSTDKQNPRSVDDQLHSCTERVRDLGGAISQVYSDAALSGMLADRPGFEQLKADIRSGQWDVVVTEELSRISRDQETVFGALKRFKSWGARFIAFSDNIDTIEDDYEFKASIKSMMGAGALREIKSRTKRALNARFEGGYSAGGRSYGYRSVPDGDRKRIAVDEREADVVRRVFTMHINGIALHSIAERLNAEGVPSARGRKWGHSAVRAMLRNRMYIGSIEFGKFEWLHDPESGKRAKKKHPESAWRRRDDQSLRIVDPETWSEAQARMKTVAQSAKNGRRGKSEYPLSGLLVCDACGSTMTSAASGRYYVCGGRHQGHGCTNSHSLSERAIRKWLMTQISEALGADEVMSGLRETMAETIGDQDRTMKAELAERRATLTRTESQISNLLEFIADSRSTAQIETKLRDKMSHAELQTAAIALLETRLNRVPTIPSRDQIVGFLRALPDLMLREPAKSKLVIGQLCGGQVRCKPPEVKGQSYMADVTLQASGLITKTTAAGAVVSHLVVAGAGSVQIRTLEIRRFGPVLEDGAPPRSAFAGPKRRRGRPSASPSPKPPLRYAAGEDSPHAKLTEARVAGIRKRLAAGESKSAIARSERVSRRAVIDIAQGKSWQPAATVRRRKDEA